MIHQIVSVVRAAGKGVRQRGVSQFAEAPGAREIYRHDGLASGGKCHRTGDAKPVGAASIRKGDGAGQSRIGGIA